MIATISGIVAAMAAAVGFGDVEKELDPRPPAAVMAHEVLETALREANNAGTDAERAAMLRAALAEARQRCPENVLVASLCERVLEPNQPSVKELQSAAEEASAILGFKIRMEADLPKGFPRPTPVGSIQLKNYPAYRLARAKTKGDSAFFKLFTHISTNRIAMTAPVEMTYASATEGKRPEAVDMAFLYGSPAIGTTGATIGGVTVEDVPERTAVSIGLRGDDSRERLEEIERELVTWLTRHAPEYERAGNLRVMGYNSPAVRASQSYWEAEIPVRKRDAGAGASVDKGQK